MRRLIFLATAAFALLLGACDASAPPHSTSEDRTEDSSPSTPAESELGHDLSRSLLGTNGKTTIQLMEVLARHQARSDRPRKLASLARSIDRSLSLSCDETCLIQTRNTGDAP